MQFKGVKISFASWFSRVQSKVGWTHFLGLEVIQKHHGGGCVRWEKAHFLTDRRKVGNREGLRLRLTLQSHEFNDPLP